MINIKKFTFDEIVDRYYKNVKCDCDDYKNTKCFINQNKKKNKQKKKINLFYFADCYNVNQVSNTIAILKYITFCN